MREPTEVWAVIPPTTPELQWPIQFHATEHVARLIADEHAKAGRPSKVVRYTLTREALTASSAAAGREEVCTGCDSHRIAAIRSVIAGRIACCPDCSTLTMGERNSIREAVKDRLAAEDKAEAGREVTEALDRIEAALDELPSREIDEFNPELGMICTESWTMLPSVYRIIRDERALAAERGREG